MNILWGKFMRVRTFFKCCFGKNYRKITEKNPLFYFFLYFFPLKKRKKKRKKRCVSRFSTKINLCPKKWFYNTIGKTRIERFNVQNWDIVETFGIWGEKVWRIKWLPWSPQRDKFQKYNKSSNLQNNCPPSMTLLCDIGEVIKGAPNFPQTSQNHVTVFSKE